MSKFRLRFLLQEIDLPLGETIVGRSSSCHITLDDPLVSRRHAVFSIELGSLTIRDLGSRNGVLVNGRLVSGVRELLDKDRVRLGTHELVVSSISLPGMTRRSQTPPTGFKWRCGSCGQLYPSGLDQCPACGMLTPREEETLTGNLPGPDGGWSLRLLSDVLDRAVSLGRWSDVQRILDRARATLSGQLVAEGGDRALLARLERAALQLAENHGDTQWVVWVLTLCATRGGSPGIETLRGLEGLPARTLAPIIPALRGLVNRSAEHGSSPGVDSDGKGIVGRLLARCDADDAESAG